MPWRLAFPDAFVEVLCRLHSDHNPLLLRCGGLPQRNGPRPFRFEAVWITHPDYQNVVKSAWDKTTPCPVAGLTQVKEDSIIFNSTVFGDIRNKKYILEKRIKGIQLSLERIDSARLFYLDQDLRQQYERLLYQEELLWYQKSREKWIKLGDRNTKFFHAQTIMRRKKNKIHGLSLPDGNWCTDDGVLRDEAQKFFMRLFGADMPPTVPTLSTDCMIFPTLSEAAKLCLSKSVTRDEVTNALHQMHAYKSPGPDGFQGIFFKQYWHIVGDDVYNLVFQAFATGNFDPRIGETLIALIPKVDNPNTFKEFRPISLCNTIYKLITKVLVNRLRPFLDQIIGPSQSSFLPGRGTCDNAIILQEVIHSMRKSKKKKGDVVFKIDLEKAYDYVNWEFLRNCLHQFGFPSITIDLIMHCVSASSLSLIWNGQRLPSFSPSRGLRQGDPLSPYLFVICMESLSHAILQAVENNVWKPVSISRNGPPLSHLFFADDVLLFSKASATQATIIDEILTSFANRSGLKVNVQKSRAFFSDSTSRSKINSIVSITGIRHTTSLEKYLGFPMLHGRLSKRDYDFLIDKIHNRLASWKHRLLNKAGRLTLVQSVLSSIPTYYMQMSWLPKTTCDHIDQMARNFLWKGHNDKGIHLVGWEKVTQPKKHGGLGIRMARESNTAMLGKLVWDIHSKKDKLWVSIIANKYVGDHLFLNTPKKPGSVVWNSIMKAKAVLRNGYAYRLGNGSSSFWYDPWSDLGRLTDQVWFVDIHDTHLTVADVIQQGTWQLSNLYTQLPPTILATISTIPVCLNASIPDGFTWKGNLDGIYSTKAGYKWLLNSHEQDNTTADLPSWKWIWRLPAPEKIKFFIWTACHNSLPTRMMLNNRGMLNTALCPRCSSYAESILHCLRDCLFPRQIWISFGFDNINFFMEQDISTWLRKGASGANNNVFIAACWWLWRARNDLCMSNETVSSYQVKINTYNSANLHSKVFAFQVAATNVENWISWHPDQGSAVVINVDGSSLGNPGPSGFGGVLRKSNGDWIFGFAGAVGISTILHVELLAIYHGLRMAWELGHREIICYSDSTLSIQLISNEINPWHHFASIISNVKDLVKRNWSVQFKHTMREANSVADLLAKKGAAGSDGWNDIWEPPVEALPLLQADASRVMFARS